MKTDKEHSRTIAAAVTLAALALSASLLGGCSTGASPALSERQFVLNGKPVHVTGLFCHADGRFSASGFIRSAIAIERGVALYSSDHGATWQIATLQPPASGVALTQFAVPGAGADRTPHLAGYRFASLSPPGPWWASSDRGASWHAVAAPLEVPPVFSWWEPQAVSHLADDPPTFAYLARAPESPRLDALTMLMRSTDNGRSWQRHDLPVHLRWASLTSDGNGHVLLSGPTPVEFFNPSTYPVFWSADAGLTWRSVGEAYSPMAYFHTGVGPVIAYNTSERKFGRTQVAYSLNHGRDFALSNDPDLASSGMIEAIASDGRGRVIAITDMHYILVTDDGGASWQIVNDLPRSAVRYPPPRLLFFDNGVAVVLMSGGLIARSTDRGDNWHSMQFPLAKGNYGFTAHCSDASGLIIAGGQGVAIRSLDYGNTWQPVELR